MIRRSSILFLVLFLVGCEEQPADTKPVIKSVLSADHYRIKPRPPKQKPKPKVTIKEEPLTEEGFPDDDEDIASTLRAHKRLGEIRYKNHLAMSELKDLYKKELPKKTEYILEDEDYSSIGIETDEFTLPVNRDRLLTQDMVIPGILESGLNSQIPGRVNVVVYRDVLSPTMKYILLPAGTRIICDYAGLEKTGQTRLAINCHRIMRPDGSSAYLESGATGGDLSGQQGLIGKVDNRWFQQYGGAFIVATISALSQASTQWTRYESINQAASSFATESGKISSKLLEKNLDMRPIMTIKPATRVILKPFNDIRFIKPIPKGTQRIKKINKEKKQNEDI